MFPLRLLRRRLSFFGCIVSALCGLSVLASPHVFAQTQDEAEALAKQFTQTYMKARDRQIDGPQEIKLGEQAVLNLPLGYSFIGSEDSADLMTLMGNDIAEGYVGMVVASRDYEMSWLLAISFTKTGWIDDSQSHLINPEALLATINSRLVTEQASRPSEERIGTLSWLVPPTYNKSARSLHWLLHAPSNKERSAEEQGINDKFILLGRHGFLVANLATSLDNLQPGLANAQAILKGLAFREGHRYDDYRAGDAKAPFDISALIVGDPARPIVEQKSDQQSNQNSAPSPVMTQGDRAPAPPIPASPWWIHLLLWGFAGVVLVVVVADGFFRRQS